MIVRVRIRRISEWPPDHSFGVPDFLGGRWIEIETATPVNVIWARDFVCPGRGWPLTERSQREMEQLLGWGQGRQIGACEHVIEIGD